MATKRVVFSVACAIALSGCADRGTVKSTLSPTERYEVRWQRLSSQADHLGSTATGHAYEYELLAVHKTFWKDVAMKCLDEAKNEGIQAFAAIAVIDSGGTITEFLPMPNSPHLRCFTTEMVGRKYPKPPVSPFYERFRFGHPVM